jgi:hypothetical protein
MIGLSLGNDDKTCLYRGIASGDGVGDAPTQREVASSSVGRRS